MASVKYSEMYADVRGKQNGTVHSKNRGGNYIRIKTKPTNPRTVFQTNQRALLAAAARAWRNLTQAQRDAWNSASADFPKKNRVADTIHLSGIDLFVEIYINTQLIGQPFLTVPPLPSAPYQISSLSIAATNAGPTLIVTFTVAPVPAGNTVLLYATRGLSAGITNANNQFKLFDIIPGPFGSGGTVHTAYVARYGTFPAVGRKIFLKMSIMGNTTGLISFPLEAFAIVT